MFISGVWLILLGYCIQKLSKKTDYILTDIFENNCNLNKKIMAEQQGGGPYLFTKQGEKVAGKSSRDYTGHGYAVYSNGEQYDGQYTNGIREGHGKYIYANGDRYEGDFRNNKKHGIGKLTYKDKGEYYGQWENGMKHGEGTYSYQNKDTYSGQWMFNKKNGQGSYQYFATKQKLLGTWKENKIVQGKWIFANGSYYQGQFKDNKPNGEGFWNLRNGNKVNGSYKQTVIPNQDPEDQKVNLKLDWQGKNGLGEAAFEVNKHQIF